MDFHQAAALTFWQQLKVNMLSLLPTRRNKVFDAVAAQAVTWTRQCGDRSIRADNSIGDQ